MRQPSLCLALIGDRRHPRSTRAALLGTAAVVLIAAASAAAVDITECDQMVPAGETGVLQADLTCSTLSGVAVTLEPSATLQLNGHTITGGVQGIFGLGPGRYRVLGPGEVTGAAFDCIVFGLAVGETGRVNALVRDVTVRDCGDNGIAANGNLRVERAVVSGNAGRQESRGIWADHYADVRDSLIEGNGRGIFAFDGVKVQNTEVLNNVAGVVAALGSVKGKDATITGNGGSGVAAGLAPWVRGRAILKRSVVSDNDAGGVGSDILSARSPRLRDTVCNLSRKWSDDGTATIGSWYVCSQD